MRILFSWNKMQISNHKWCKYIQSLKMRNKKQNKTNNITDEHIYFMMLFLFSWFLPYLRPLKPIHYHIFVWNFTKCPTSFVMCNVLFMLFVYVSFFFIDLFIYCKKFCFFIFKCRVRSFSLTLLLMILKCPIYNS